MVKIIFVYDETLRKWEPVVEGAKDEVEAQQAFAAVALTIKQANLVLTETIVKKNGDGSFTLTPVVL